MGLPKASPSSSIGHCRLAEARRKAAAKGRQKAALRRCAGSSSSSTVEGVTKAFTSNVPAEDMTSRFLIFSARERLAAVSQKTDFFVPSEESVRSILSNQGISGVTGRQSNVRYQTSSAFVPPSVLDNKEIMKMPVSKMPAFFGKSAAKLCFTGSALRRQTVNVMLSASASKSGQSSLALGNTESVARKLNFNEAVPLAPAVSTSFAPSVSSVCNKHANTLISDDFPHLGTDEQCSWLLKHLSFERYLHLADRMRPFLYRSVDSHSQSQFLPVVESLPAIVESNESDRLSDSMQSPQRPPSFLLTPLAPRRRRRFH